MDSWLLFRVAATTHTHVGALFVDKIIACALLAQRHHHRRHHSKHVGMLGVDNMWGDGTSFTTMHVKYTLV